MKLKILAVVVLGAVGVGAAVYAMGGLSTSAASTTQYLTSAATTGDVTDDVAATGALAAQSSYGLVFGSDPYLITATATAPNSTTTWPVKEVKVKVGDTVAKGDVLATADTTDLKRNLANATNSLKSAQVSLRAAKTDLSDAEDADVTARSARRRSVSTTPGRRSRRRHRIATRSRPRSRRPRSRPRSPGS